MHLAPAEEILDYAFRARGHGFDDLASRERLQRTLVPAMLVDVRLGNCDGLMMCLGAARINQDHVDGGVDFQDLRTEV